MATTKVIKQYQGDLSLRFTLPKGAWIRVTSDGTPTARMACPECGAQGTLTDHEISPTGAVTPSVLCTGEGCSYHKTGVTLEGWTG